MGNRNSNREVIREEFLQIMLDCINGKFKDFSQGALIYECWERVDNALVRRKNNGEQTKPLTERGMK